MPYLRIGYCVHESWNFDGGLWQLMRGSCSRDAYSTEDKGNERVMKACKEVLSFPCELELRQLFLLAMHWAWVNACSAIQTYLSSLPSCSKLYYALTGSRCTGIYPLSISILWELLYQVVIVGENKTILPYCRFFFVYRTAHCWAADIYCISPTNEEVPGWVFGRDTNGLHSDVCRYRSRKAAEFGI